MHWVLWKSVITHTGQALQWNTCSVVEMQFRQKLWFVGGWKHCKAWSRYRIIKQCCRKYFQKHVSSQEMFSFRNDLEKNIETALFSIMEKDMYSNSNQVMQCSSSGLHKCSVSRTACLQSILKTPLSEVVSSPTWKELQKVLCEELSHADSTSFALVVQIHSKLLT